MGEKSFRIGAVGGGDQNPRVLITNKAKKHGRQADNLQRGDGARRGGRRVVVRLGARWYGVDRAFLATGAQFVGQVFFCQVLLSRYSVEAAKMSRAAGVADYVFFQDGAPANAAKVIQAECADLFPSFVDKKGCPSNIPD